MYKVKRFSQQRSFGMKAAGIGAVGGVLGGAKLGNELHAKYDYHKAKHDYDPEAEAAEEDRKAEEYDAKKKELLENKEYMKRHKKAEEKLLKAYKKADEGDEYDYTPIAEAEDEFDRDLPEGDVYDYENRARLARNKAKDIRENPEKYREEAGVNAKKFRKVNPGIGAKSGAAIGAIGGGLLGSKI